MGRYLLSKKKLVSGRTKRGVALNEVSALNEVVRYVEIAPETMLSILLTAGLCIQ